MITSSMNIAHSQMVKNYFRKGSKIKGTKFINKSLVELKEREIFKEIGNSILIDNFGDVIDKRNGKIKKSVLNKIKKIKNKKKKKLAEKIKKGKKRKIKKKKNLKHKRDGKKKPRRLKPIKSTGFSLTTNFPGTLNQLAFRSNVEKKKPAFYIKELYMRRFNYLKNDGCNASRLFLNGLNNGRLRIFLRNRWIAGKRLKIPFYSSPLRDLRYACKTLMKTVVESKQVPSFLNLLREIHLSLIFKGSFINKRILVYQILYKNAVYSNSLRFGVRKKRKKKINRY